jgi:carboxymethylenebutenolidase
MLEKPAAADYPSFLLCVGVARGRIADKRSFLEYQFCEGSISSMPIFSRRQFLEGSASGVAALSFGVTSLCAQDWARKAVDQSPRRREWVTVKHDGRSVESMVAYPQSKEKAPAMVVIHEIFGMTDWVEDVAVEFAEAGYITIAPDLLSGMGPNGGRTKDFPASGGGGFGPAAQAVMKLPADQVAADLNAVADYCKSLSACNGKVCVVGFSWGGGEAFRCATYRKDLSASLVFYGTGPAANSISSIQAPVYGFYAGTDTRVNGSIPQTQEQMKAAGKFYETATYDGAAHGFMRTGEQPNAAEADKKARDAAWAKIKTLTAKFK